MARQTKRTAQDVDQTIGGESYRLRFGLMAWGALERQWGCSSIQETQAKMAGMGENLSVSTLIDILWAALRAHHRELTVDDVGIILDDAGMQGVHELAEALPKLISSSMPPDGAAENPPGAAKAAT